MLTQSELVAAAAVISPHRTPTGGNAAVLLATVLSALAAIVTRDLARVKPDAVHRVRTFAVGLPPVSQRA